MIDVIIPAYKSHSTIKRTLYSIACQKNSDDLNVYIINDNPDDNYDTEINFFKHFLKIKELKYDKNRGPGYARQYGLNNSCGDYIVFIDSDDIFSSPLSILKMYKEIVKDDFDVLVSTFYEQSIDNIFYEYKNDSVGLHGKMFKRKFLEENNIVFPDLYSEEDNSFNQLIILYNPKVKYIEDVTYVWLYNNNSIVRKDNYNKNIDIKYLKAMYYVANKVKNDKNINKHEFSIFCFKPLVALYYYNLDYNNIKK